VGSGRRCTRLIGCRAAGSAPTAGSASAILGALMFAGGVLVTPLMALGGEGTAVPMVAVVAGGAIAALLATALLTLRR
jgi:MFS transporter, DHA1 family, multidrug resistance protein